MDVQTTAALAVVAITACWLAVRAFRGLRRPGCGACACAPAVKRD